jgi:hypothetical protein
MSGKIELEQRIQELRNDWNALYQILFLEHLFDPEVITRARTLKELIEADIKATDDFIIQLETNLRIVKLVKLEEKYGITHE